MMRALIDLGRSNCPQASLPLAECTDVVDFDLNLDEFDDRAALEEMAAWLYAESASGTWRRWTNPLRNRWFFGFDDPVTAVRFKLTFV